MATTRDIKDRSQRHPEKAHRPDTPILKKPNWIRVKAPTSEGYRETRDILRANRLVTVCEQASCPNVGECWSQGHATMMIMGDICTRGCTFCNIATGRPDALDPFEPGRVAVAVEKLGLRHVVITSVDRDDLEDGGAGHIAQTIRAVRRKTPDTTIEVLTPDFLKCPASAIEAVVEARPDVFNHNPRRCRASTRRSAPARATSTRFGSCSGSRSSIRPASPSRASWSASARTARRCSRSWTTCGRPTSISSPSASTSSRRRSITRSNAS